MSTENIPSHANTASMTDHPDIVAMNARYERAAETPSAQATDGMTVVAGLFIALSPWIVGFSGFTTLAINNLVVGLTVALLGLGFAYAYERTHRLAWVCPVLGAWTIISVWAVSGVTASVGMVLSNVIAGGIVVLLGIGAGIPMLNSSRGGSPSNGS